MDVSTGLVRKLPQLIHRFGSKPETAAQILRLVQYVKLDKYDELRQLEAFEKLLEDVGKQFMNHTDSNVFKEASASLLHAQKFERLGYLTEPKVIELQDEVNSSFLSMVNGKDLISGQLTSEGIGDLTIAIARLENLLSVADCTMALGDENTKQGKSSFTLFVDLIERSVTIHDPEEIDMVSHAIKALRWYFMWRIRAISGAEGDHRIDHDALEDLRDKRTNVIDELSQVVTQRPADELRIQAATLLLDLYTLFTTLPKSSRDQVLPGGTTPPQRTQDNITNVLEEEISLLHLSEKKSSKIILGENDQEEEDEEDEDEEMGFVGDLPPEARGAIHEKRVIELGAKMVLAVLGGALPKSFSQTLLHHKGKAGQSFDKLLLELGVESKPVEKFVQPQPAAEPVVVDELVENEVEDS